MTTPKFIIPSDNEMFPAQSPPRRSHEGRHNETTGGPPEVESEHLLPPSSRFVVQTWVTGLLFSETDGELGRIYPPLEGVFRGRL